MIPAGSLFPRLALALDDPTLIHSADTVLLGTLSRAQQWVALRYKLLTQTFPLSLVPTGALYAVQPLLSRAIVVIAISLSNGTTLFLVPLDRLQHWDTQWIATPGTPQWFYRIGYSIVGVYPVPTTSEQAHATAIVAPAQLVLPTQLLEIPDSYVDNVLKVAKGILLLSAERQYQDGVAMIRDGLGMPTATPPAGGANAAR